MNKLIGIIALIWALCFFVTTFADAQITDKTVYFNAGRQIQVTALNVDSATARYSDLIDISHMDGDTIYLSGYAYDSDGGGSHDSVKVMMLAYYRVGSNDFYVGLDTFYIPVRTTRDSAESILQTPRLTPTGFAPAVKLAIISGSSGTNEQTARDVAECFFTLYGRREDTVPPSRQFNIVRP